MAGTAQTIPKKLKALRLVHVSLIACGNLQTKFKYKQTENQFKENYKLRTDVPVPAPGPREILVHSECKIPAYPSLASSQARIRSTSR